jgi:dephospho-CoA kinase
VTAILVTGMSGTGKSTVLRELAARGHDVVDTDSDAWSRWVTLRDGSRDWVWREADMERLLAGADGRTLFVAGCKSNQGVFYPSFDAVVLLTAPADVLLERIERRDDNPYGKSAEERALVLHHVATVEPLLRRTATHVLDTDAPLTDVVASLEEIAGVFGSTGGGS